MMAQTDMTKVWGEEMTDKEIEEMSLALGNCEVCGGRGEICIPAYVKRGNIIDEECMPCRWCQKTQKSLNIKNKIKRLAKTLNKKQ